MIEKTDWDNDISGEGNSDEDIIELTQIVEDRPGGEDDDIIELTDIVEPESTDFDPDILVEDISEAEDNFSFETAETRGNDFEDQDIPSGDDPAGLEIDAPVSGDIETEVRTDGADISPERFEAALERVIEKKFSNKIDAILFEVMEKVMEKELASIREALQNDLDQIGND